MTIYKNPFEISVTGQELKDWVWHHTHSRTRYTSVAKGMMSCFNLDNNKFYAAQVCDGAPVINEVAERGIAYEVPCDSINRDRNL